jgi:hypothetical protein
MNIITKLRFLNLTLSYWGKLEKVPMKVSVNGVSQLLALIAQYGVQASDYLPTKGKFWTAVAITAIQGVLAVLAHFKNPDGTPSSTPYKSLLEGK